MLVPNVKLVGYISIYCIFIVSSITISCWFAHNTTIRLSVLIDLDCSNLMVSRHHELHVVVKYACLEFYPRVCLVENIEILWNPSMTWHASTDSILWNPHVSWQRRAPAKACYRRTLKQCSLVKTLALAAANCDWRRKLWVQTSKK